MRIALLIASTLLLAGCTTAKVIVMKDPKTGQVMQCGASEHETMIFPIAQTAINNGAAEDCAKGYAAAGWQRMN